MNELNLELLILHSLVTNNDFIRKTIPHIKGDYFEESENKKIFKVIKDYFLKYNRKISYIKFYF
jgi:replicative DNA helicase